MWTVQTRNSSTCEQFKQSNALGVWMVQTNKALPVQVFIIVWTIKTK